MDIYPKVYDLLLTIPLIKAWPEMHVILERAVSDKPRDWQLPVLACKAVGGKEEKAIPTAAAIACLQISIILIDDMLDADPRGEYQRVGAPVAANMAAAFQAVGLEVVAQSNSFSQPQKLAIQRSLNQMTFTVAYGQHKDSQNPVDEASYWRLVETKSAPFFGAALQIGALAGLPGAETRTTTHLRQLGKLYGEMIQIHDDLNDTMAQPANPDWLLGRSPLPILFAKLVTHPQQARFWALCDAMPDPDALVEAQNILIRCGAISYCVSELLSRYREAQDLLNRTSLAYKAGLVDLLTDVIQPVQQMFDAIEGILPSPNLGADNCRTLSA